MRPRNNSPCFVRSSDHVTNSQMVRKNKKHRRRIEKTRTVGVFIKNAFGTKDRFIYIGT